MVSRRLIVIVCGVLSLLTLGTPRLAAAAKDYRADRFDVRLIIEPGGSLLVTETVSFVFGNDTFSSVSRGLPTRRTDGLSVVAVSMDGSLFTPGDEPGQFEFGREKNGERRVVWHFETLTRSAHTFVLTYRAAGVVRREQGADLLEWRALPTKHAYGITCASVELEFPPTAALAGDVAFEPPAAPARVGQPPRRFERCGFERDDSWLVRARFGAQSVVTTMPDWERRAVKSGQGIPLFLGLGAMIALLGLGGFGVFALNHRSDVRDDAVRAQHVPPETLPAALAGALSKNGRVTWDAALATILDLARHGVIGIEELSPGGVFSSRDFKLTARATHRALRPHEQVICDLLFTGKEGPRPSVKFSELGKVFSSAARWKRFAAAVTGDLRAAGVYDPERERTRHRATLVAVAIIVLAILGLIATVPFVHENGGATLMMAVATLVVGLVGIGVAQSLTPLNDEAVRRARQWQAYGRHLKTVTKDGGLSSATPAAFEHALPYAAAFGVALAWASTLQKHGVTAGPPWLHALAREGAATAGNMPAMVALLTAAQSHANTVNHASTGVSAGGAAGGGSSSAG